jgi:hypothetical protein
MHLEVILKMLKMIDWDKTRILPSLYNPSKHSLVATSSGTCAIAENVIEERNIGSSL